MVRNMLELRRMMVTARFLVVFAAFWAGTGGHASADKFLPGASNVSTDDQRVNAAKVGIGRRIAAEPRRGVKAAKLRKGEKLAPAQVPEFDPNAAGLALVLLVGGALLAVDRRRQQQS